MGRDYYSKSNLYVCSDGANHEQVMYVFKDIFQQMAKLYPEDPDITRASFLINVVETKPKDVGSERVSYPNGLTYAWVSHPKMYNMLIGNNPDGSERCRYIKPDVQPKKETKMPLLWGDVEDDEEPIKVCLPPLFNIPIIHITDDQVNQVAERLKMAPGDVPRNVTVSISPSYIVLPDSAYDASTICCRDAPQWVTKEQMLTYFERFNTDPALYMLPIDKVDVRIHYPQVRIKPNKRGGNIIFVAFSKNADHISNASFALQMCRKGLTVTNVGGNESTVLSFSHWKNTKDMGSRSVG